MRKAAPDQKSAGLVVMLCPESAAKGNNMVWGSIISAGASLAGSLLNKSSAGDQIDASREMSAANLEMQKQFAQEGIRWRVADAKAAGIHPLYALGAQLPSYSPSTYVPGDSGNIGGGLADAGAHIGRAIDATRTPEEKVSSRLDELTLTRAELENDLLRSQIAKLNQSPTVGMPPTKSQMIPGQADIERMGLTITPSEQHVVEKPQEVIVSSPGIPSQEPFPITDTGFVRTPTGLAPVPSKDAKERIEDQFVPEAMWSLRNHIIPTLGMGGSPPSHHLLPPGAESWRWSRSAQEWQPIYEGGRTRDELQWDWDNPSRERVFNGLGVSISRERR